MQRFKNILCVVDPENGNRMGLERALTLAEKNNANLTVINVFPGSGMNANMIKQNIMDDIEASVMASKNEQLKSFVDTFPQKIKIYTKILVGTPFLEIIYEVLRNEYDLVIKTPTKLEWMDRIFGSDDMHLLRKCPCPVWMIHKDTPKSYKNILATIDISNSEHEQEIKANESLNVQILKMAGSLAVSELANLHIVHAWYLPGESMLQGARLRMDHARILEYTKNIKRIHEEKLDTFIDKISTEKTGELIDFLKPKKHLVKGFPNKVIPEFAKNIDADLVVMGTIGRTGIPGLIIGNTAEDILNQIHCSVLAVKPSDFVSPVTLKK
ncbi:MAG: universal stress protein [Sulfurovum sp.]|uniref:universal stress protein n=1 Tax=Sulfurovum sp. TaxID=1969726 RepID=UPI003C730D1E